MEYQRSANTRTTARAAIFMVATLLLIRFTHAGDSGQPGEPWQTTVERNHPLVGQVWDVAAAEFLDPQTLVTRLAQGQFVMLGEKHDNPDHHRLQSWVLNALITAGRRPAVGFEMFDTDDAPAIAGHLAVAPTDAVGLATAVNWSQSGWPDWDMYRPIAEIALAGQLPIVATNFPASLTHILMHQGTASLDADLVRRLDLSSPLAPEVYAQMANEIRDSHCGHAPESMIEAMIVVQRARDAQMADSLVSAKHKDGAVLIAGSLHSRKDRGVPAHLARLVPHASVVSLAFLEVQNGRLEPTAYASQREKGELPFDYVWFTPRVDNTDPCDKFHHQLKHIDYVWFTPRVQTMADPCDKFHHQLKRMKDKLAEQEE